MRFSDIHDTLQTLDRAYETIEAEHRSAPGAGALPAWESIVRGRPRREPGVATGDLLCAKHGGAPHGLPYDALTDHLTSEMSEWIRIAEHSPTARSILGIERLERAAGARVAAMTYLDDDREIVARFSTTGATLVPTDAGRWMWAQEPHGQVGFRPRAERDEPHLLFSNEEGKGRRWSFSDVRKGYEEYLKATGRRADEAAWSRLSTCPTPRLLGSLSDYNLRNPTERAPLALSEAWLWDGTGTGEIGGELAGPCEACRFGLSAWMCGHGEILRKADPAYAPEYAAHVEEWATRLREREREEPQQRAAAAVVNTVSAPSGTGARHAEAGAVEPGQLAPTSKILRSSLAGALAAADAGTGAIGTGAAAVSAGATPAIGAGATPAIGTGAAAMSAGATPAIGAGAAAVSAGARGAVDPGMLDLPERDVTGAYRHRRGSGQGTEPARVAFSSQERRERVRVRLESGDFACDNVEVRELSGREAISKLFSFHVDIVCFDEDGLDTAKLLGAGVSLVFEQGSLEARRVHGIVAEVRDNLETESEWRSYRLWIVPRAWRSTLVETQEVYLDTTVPDLIQQKLALVRLSADDVEMRLMGNYPVRELIVQYKETDVAFVSRLAEHLGICFYFEHDGGTDKIVFSDSNAGFRPLPGAEVLPFRPRGEKVDVFEVSSRARAFPASFAMQDYNYRTPLVDLTSVIEAQDGFAGGVVEYGAHYKTPAEGAALAKVRAEERQIENQDFTCKSDVAQVAAGGKFRLSGHARLGDMELLVTDVEHFVRQTVKMQGAGSEEVPYRNTFRAVDAALPYRPPRATPRPRIHGVLTALVEPNPGGEIGESARIDPEGRYTVKFYFDAGDVAGRQKNSRPVRMIQAHAGPRYGIHFPLKPGIEVLIVFMDGDPDRPLIVGSVPNPVTPSPVVEEVNLMNRIETASGLIIEMRDAVPPLNK